MKTTLQIFRDHLATLEAFEAKYQPGESVRLVGDLPCAGDRLPWVIVKGQDAAAREWSLSNFTRDGWLVGGIENDGWVTAKKVVDGVEVRLYQAYRVRVFSCDGPQPVNPQLFGVREVEVAA